MKSGEPTTLSPTQRTILEHISRYRLSFTEIIEHVCCDGQNSRSMLDGLCRGEQPLVTTVGGFQGRRKAFVLTKRGSKVVTGSIERSKAPSENRINLLAFCCLSGKKRVSLEPDEVQQFFGQALPGRHLVMQCSGTYCLHSVYIPGSSTKDQTIVAKMEQKLEEVAQCDGSDWKPPPAAWLEAGKLRVTTIVATPEKAHRVNNLLQKRLSIIDHPATRHCSVVAANSPRLEELLRDLRHPN